MNRRNPTKNYSVHSLERGLDLIELLTDKETEVSLTEISQEIGFSKTTTHRILKALKSRGYMQQDPVTLNWKPSYKLFEIGNKVVRSLNIRKEAIPVLTKLANETGETAYLMIRDKDEALCLERIDGFQNVRILYLQVGGRVALHVGAGPRTLLAHLPEEEIDRIIQVKGLPRWTPKSITHPGLLKRNLRKIRENGYALSFEDVTEGASAVGCPVRDWMNEVVAAISISGFANHFNRNTLPHLISITKAGALELSRRLHAPPHSDGTAKKRIRKNGS
jgi:IclR family transcriptional regulator, KDG regulon repressor